MKIENVFNKEFIGANSDWLLTKNWSETPIAVKNIDKVQMIIFEGTGNKNAELSIHHNKYIPIHKKTLSFKDFESACNEADDYYRAILTTAIGFLTEQIQLLPEM